MSLLTVLNSLQPATANQSIIAPYNSLNPTAFNQPFNSLGPTAYNQTISSLGLAACNQSFKFNVSGKYFFHNGHT